MYELRLHGATETTQHTRIDNANAEVLLDLARRRPDITRDVIASMTQDEKRQAFGPLDSEILHDGHSLTGCDIWSRTITTSRPKGARSRLSSSCHGPPIDSQSDLRASHCGTL